MKSPGTIVTAICPFSKITHTLDRVGNWSETRQKHISPIIVQDENGNVLYRCGVSLFFFKVPSEC